MFQELCFFLDYYNYDFLHPVNKFQCSWCIGNKTAFLSQQQQQITWASGCNRATWDSSCNNLLETTDATVYLRQQLQQKFDTAADTVYLRLPLNQLNREGSCTVYLRHRSYNRLRKTAAATAYQRQQLQCRPEKQHTIWTSCLTNVRCDGLTAGSRLIKAGFQVNICVDLLLLHYSKHWNLRISVRIIQVNKHKTLLHIFAFTEPISWQIWDIFIQLYTGGLMYKFYSFNVCISLDRLKRVS